MIASTAPPPRPEARPMISGLLFSCDSFASSFEVSVGAGGMYDTGDPEVAGILAAPLLNAIGDGTVSITVTGKVASIPGGKAVTIVRVSVDCEVF